MTTERKAAANRRNAQHSTGPRTAEGKRIASQNAVTMGFFARTVLLPHEDASALQALQDGLIVQFRPVGLLEEWFVARMVGCLWRLRRVQLTEAGVFAQDCTEELARRALSAARGGAELGEAELLGAALATTAYRAHQLATLGRAEAALGREFYRALHELQRLQAARRGEAVAPPAAVDVTVGGPDEGPAIRSAASRSMSPEKGATSAITLPPEAVRAAADPPPSKGGEDPKAAAVEGEATGAESILRNAVIAEGVDPQAQARAAAQARAQIALGETDPLGWSLSGPGRDRSGRPGCVPEPAQRCSARGRRARRRVSGVSTSRPHPPAVEATQADERRGTGDDQGAAFRARSGTRTRPRKHGFCKATRRASAVGEAGTPPEVLLQNEPTVDEGAAPLPQSDSAAPPPPADGGDLPPAAAPAGGSPDVAAGVSGGSGRCWKRLGEIERLPESTASLAGLC